MADTDLDTLVQQLRILGVRAKVIDELERTCRQFPDAAAGPGFDVVRAAVSGALANPHLSQSGLLMLESLLLAHLQQVVGCAMGHKSDLHRLLD